MTDNSVQECSAKHERPTKVHGNVHTKIMIYIETWRYSTSKIN